MRKKLFAILLSLCMVITMMPSMAMAGSDSGGGEDANAQTESLYAVWLKDEVTPTDGVIDNSNKDKIDRIVGTDITNDTVLELEVGREKDVEYLCISSGTANQYKVINLDADDINCDTGLSVKKDSGNGRYYFSHESNETTSGTITVNYDSKTYTLNYNVELPTIGAYKGTDFSTENFIKGKEIKYNDLTESADDGKYVYFVANINNDRTIANMVFEKWDNQERKDVEYTSEYLQTASEGDNTIGFHPATTTDGVTTPAYLKVKVSENIAAEDFNVRIKYEDTDSEGGTVNGPSYYFEIASNVMYQLDCSREYKSMVGTSDDTITTDNRSDSVFVAPGYPNTCNFGIPTGNTNEYKVVEPYVKEREDDKEYIKIEEFDDGYRISMGEDAEINQTYYLYAKDGNDVEYKIPVNCGFPNIGLYKSSTKDANALLAGSQFSINDFSSAQDVQKDDNGNIKLYLIIDTNREVSNVTLEGDYSEDLITLGEKCSTKTVNNETVNLGYTYVPVTISSNVVSERFQVKATVSGNERPWESDTFVIAGNVMYRLPYDSGDLGYDSTNGTATPNWWDDSVYIAPGDEGWLNIGIRVDGNDNKYTLVTLSDSDISKTNTGDNIKVEKEENGYKIVAGESAELGKTYYIYYTDSNDVEYKLPVHYNLPSIGAYTKYTDEMDSEDETKVIKREFSFGDLRANSEDEISYNDLDPVENEDYRIVYFVANTDSNATVTDITIEDGNSEYIEVPENGYHAAIADTHTPAYLEAHVSKDIVSEECRVSVKGKYREDGDEINLCDPVTFTISGNLMYALNIVQQSQIDAGDTIQCEYCDSQVELTPNSERGYYFAVPVEGEDSDNLYKIVDSVTAPAGIEITSSENGFVNIKAKEGTKLGTYYLTGTVTETTGTGADAKTTTTTYKIPVRYELPTLGLYKDTTPSVDNFVSESEVYYGDLDDSGDKTVYLIVNTDGDVKSLNLNVSYGGDAIEKGEFVSATEDTCAYVPITIKENVENSGIEVGYNITWGDGNDRGNRWLWFYGGKSGSSGGSEATAENGDVVVCTKSVADYTPLPTYYVDGNDQEASSPAEFYLDENSDGKFYVLVSTTSKYNSAKSLTLEYLDSYYEVDESKDPFATAEKKDEPYALGDKTYNVWEVTVPNDKKTGEHRLAFKFGDGLATYQTGNEDESENFHTYFMWVLGNGYKPASYNEYTDGILVFDCNTMPTGTYGDLSELYKEYKADNYADWEISYNLSENEDSDDNTFYVIYPEGTYLCENSYEQHTYELNGSSGWSNGRNYAGYFMQKIDGGAYTINRINRDVSTVTINDGYNSETYSVAKINLKNTHGNYKIYTEFYVTNAENNGKVVGGYSANILLMKGMNIIIQGANAVEQFNTGSEIIDVALGNSGEAQLKYVETGDNYVKYYLPNAAANISDQGTGRYLDFAIDLKDGYVIDNIKMESTKDSNETKSTVGFTYEKTTFYSPLDKNGDPIEDFTYIRNELGWAFSLAGNGDQMLIDTSHVVAASTPTYVKEKYQEAKIGDENLSDFINFRNEHPDLETVERLTYNDYSLIFDDALDSTDTRQLVFNVSKAKVGNGIAAKNSEGSVDENFEAKADDSVNETVASELAGNLEVLEPTEDGEEYQVVKTYDMSTTANDGKIDGLYNITIPASELEGVDLKNCKVVYYNSENVPMEMETTYTTDENGNVTGIVFTTGHFSNYAIVTTGEAKSNPTPSGGGSAGGAAVTTDNVTNTAENKATDTPATTTATVKAETKTDSTGAKTTTATVDSTTASKIVTKAVENKSEEIVVDTSSKATVTETAAGAKTEVSIPAETIAQISEKTEAEVVIKTDAAEVVLDEKTVEAVAEQAGSTGDVKLVVETVAQDDSKLEVELKLVSSNGNVTDFNGGNVNITVKLGKTLAAKKLICVYIDDNGTYHKVSGQLNADGTYTFTTTHFSRYAIMAEEDVDKIIAEQNAKVEKMVGDLTLKARSSKTSKGNIKVKLITDSSDIKDLEDLGYTVKYKFYRSTKKSSGYSAKIEKDSKTYTNTTGKKGTRYYYKARVIVYDAQGNPIAKSALKQCKYATRKR